MHECKASHFHDGSATAGQYLFYLDKCQVMRYLIEVNSLRVRNADSLQLRGKPVKGLRLVNLKPAGQQPVSVQSAAGRWLVEAGT